MPYLVLRSSISSFLRSLFIFRYAYEEEGREEESMKFLSCQVTCIGSAHHMIRRTPTHRGKVHNVITLNATRNSYDMNYVIVILDVRNSSGSQHVPMIWHSQSWI
jgi:hypothetical protein